MKLQNDVTLYGGRYRITRCIGNGGFGITYLAWDNQLRREVVLKEYFPKFMVRRDVTVSPDVHTLDEGYHVEYHKGIERFLSEAQTLAKLNDIPEIADVHDFFQENNTAYIVMEFIKGKNLKQCIKERPYPYTFEEAIDLLRPCLIALQRVHAAGLIHRDFTPDNIILTDNGEPKIIDFGSSREYVGNEATMTIMVKHGYAPAEQYSSRVKQGTYTDVYSISAIIYEMLTLHKPVPSIERTVNDPLEPISMYNQLITREQEQVILKGMAVDWSSRYQEICELLADATKVSHKQMSNVGVYDVMNNTSASDDTMLLGNAPTEVATSYVYTEKKQKKKDKKDNRAKQKQQSVNDTVLLEQPKKRKKSAAKIKLLAILILLATLSVGGAVLFFKLQPDVVKINEYIEFEAKGYSGIGEGTFEINYKKIAKDCKKLKYTSKAQEDKKRDIKSKTPAEYITEYITIVPDAVTGLSNGQVINYTIEIDEEIYDYVKCEIIAESGTEKVSGLKDVDTFNPFDDFSIDYEGNEGKARAVFNYTGSELNVNKFECANVENLKNGDILKVTISDETIEQCIDELNAIPVPNEMEFTVSGLTHRLIKGEEIEKVKNENGESEALSKIDSQASDIIKQYTSTHKPPNNSSEVFGDTVSVGYIILTSKDDESNNATTSFYRIYKTAVSVAYDDNNGNRYDQDAEFYWLMTYTNPMVNDDGSIAFDVLDYELSNKVVKIENPYSYYTWDYMGYDSWESLYDTVVVTNMEKFNHEEVKYE